MPPRRDDRRVQVFGRAASLALALAAAACGESEVPANPTWSQVEPILRAECGHCHGSSADDTGGGIRFDFFDMTASPCGEAGAVLGAGASARLQANSIAEAITTSDENVRPIMPPIPAQYLSEREWRTILHWTANPLRGDKPATNLPPRIRVDGTPTIADQTLDINVIVDDPEGEPVVGVVKVGEVVGQMDRAGSFAARFDTSSWPAGTVSISAVICDGWSQVSVPLLDVDIVH